MFAWLSAGPEYARRHMRMDAAMRAYLTGSEAEQVAPSAAHRAGGIRRGDEDAGGQWGGFLTCTDLPR